jgi:hypothetical protein
MALDSQGNLIVAGSTVTLKYSNTGLPLWTNSQGFDAKSVAIDDQDHIYVCGVDSPYSRLTIKTYAADGNLLWTNQYAVPGFTIESQTACALDQERNLIVAGYRLHHFETLAFSSAGVSLWTNIYEGPVGGEHHPQAVAVDAAGDVFVTGYSYGPGGSYYQYDFLTIKYSPSVPLKFERIANAAVLTWGNSNFLLQSSSAVTGAFTNVTGATSPYTNTLPGTVRFFRLVYP